MLRAAIFDDIGRAGAIDTTRAGASSMLILRRRRRLTLLTLWMRRRMKIETSAGMSYRRCWKHSKLRRSDRAAARW